MNQLQKDSYNRFVINNETGSFLQSWEWGSWQETLGRKVFRFWILGDIGGQVASMQLIKMPLPLGRYYLYAPYGPVLAEGESDGLQVTGYKFLVQVLQKKFSDAIFIRIEPKFDPPPTTHHPSSIKTKNIQPGKTLLIDLSKSEELLLSEMHHKTRYNIKVAQKHGVETKDEFDITNGHGLFFDEALQLITQTSKRQKFATFGAEYYKKMVDSFALKNRGDVKLHVYKAIFQNQLLATAIILDFGKTRTFLFGGSSEFHKNVMAPYLLHWQAMQDAKSQGMNFYDFWGTETSSGDTPGFVRFKLGFAPQLRSGPSAPQSDSGPSGGIKEYGGAYDVVLNKILYKLYSGLRAGNKIIKKIRHR